MTRSKGEQRRRHINQALSRLKSLDLETPLLLLYRLEEIARDIKKHRFEEAQADLVLATGAIKRACAILEGQAQYEQEEIYQLELFTFSRAERLRFEKKRKKKKKMRENP